MAKCYELLLQLSDEIVVADEDLARVGAGYVKAGFEADPERSFNWGCT